MEVAFVNVATGVVPTVVSYSVRVTGAPSVTVILSVVLVEVCSSQTVR
jgi:hypothetical protein